METKFNIVGMLYQSYRTGEVTSRRNKFVLANDQTADQAAAFIATYLKHNDLIDDETLTVEVVN